MMVLGLLVLLLGFLSVSHGLDCVVETLKCSRLRVNIEPHKNLMVTSEALDALCRRQEMFYDCLGKVVRSHSTVIGMLPAELLKPKVLTKELCSEDSVWRRRYLDSARCINRQQTDLCTSPHFLASIDRSGISLDGCLLREKAVNCIAVTLAMNCGIDAGNVFHYLLKMTSDGSENCNSVGSEVIHSCPSPVDNDTKVEVLNGIYNDLLKRIGDIPDQEDEKNAGFVLMDRDGESEELDEVSEIAEETTDAREDYAKADSTSLLVEHAVTTDQNVSKSEYVGKLNISKRLHQSEIDQLVAIFAPVNFTKRLLGLTIYNHPDGRVFAYFRLQNRFYLERFNCSIFRHKDIVNGSSFWCHFKLRYRDPKCLDGSIPSASDVDITREQIEFDPFEIDPELGAKLHPVKYRAFEPGYTFQQWVDTSEYLFYPPTINYFTTTISENAGEQTDEGNGEEARGSTENEQVSEDQYEKMVENIFTEMSNIDGRKSGDIDSLSESFDLDNSKLFTPDVSRGYSIQKEETKIQKLLEAVTQLETSSELEAASSLEEEIPGSSRGGVTSGEENLYSETLGSIFQTSSTFLDEIVEDITSTPVPNQSGSSNSGGLPEEIKNDLIFIFTVSDENDPKYQIYPDGTTVIIWPGGRIMSMESVLCGRVNECHPKAKNVVKCSITPASSVKDAESSSNEETESTPRAEINSAFQTGETLAEAESVSEAQDYTPVLQVSDLADMESSEEPTTILYLSDEGTELVDGTSEVDSSLLSSNSESDYIHISIPINQLVDEQTGELESELSTSTEGIQMLLFQHEPEHLNAEGDIDVSDAEEMNPDAEESETGDTTNFNFYTDVLA